MRNQVGCDENPVTSAKHLVQVRRRLNSPPLPTCLKAKIGMVWNAAQLSSCFTHISSYQLPADLNARLFQIAKVDGGGVWGGVVRP